MAAAAAIAGRRFMSLVTKPSERAAVHGVRTPLASNFGREEEVEVIFFIKFINSFSVLSILLLLN